MVTVRKPDVSAWLCMDFKTINNITQPVPYYMPRVEEVLESIGKACVISKIDLTKGYYQVPTYPPDIPKTAFTLHKSCFEFLRMPFGVKNAQVVFQGLCRACLEMPRPLAVHIWTISSSLWELGRSHQTR